MVFFYVFLAGLIIGDFTTKKPSVVVIENGNVVDEIKADNEMMVIKSGDSVELRKAKEPEAQAKKVPVVGPGKPVFRRDAWGGFTADCKTCYEDAPHEDDEVVWKDQH